MFMNDIITFHLVYMIVINESVQVTYTSDICLLLLSTMYSVSDMSNRHGPEFLVPPLPLHLLNHLFPVDVPVRT